VPEEEGTMVIKTDHVPDATGQQPINTPRKSHSTLHSQPALRLAGNAGQALLTLFAVFSGLTGSQENLERIGIYLGPTHL
jgi:hypothetical protein